MTKKKKPDKDTIDSMLAYEKAMDSVEYKFDLQDLVALKIEQAMKPLDWYHRDSVEELDIVVQKVEAKDLDEFGTKWSLFVTFLPKYLDGEPTLMSLVDFFNQFSTKQDFVLYKYDA